MGSVVVSVDAELGWGFHDVRDPPRARVEAGRAGWRTLLDVFDAHGVPATWAVVGHLMLSGCDGVHADHPSVGGWFDRERGAWRDRPDLRFGADLVDGILDANASHEVASHTFSHVLFDDPRVTPEVASAELAAAAAAARPFGVEYDSVVFPRNAVGHREVLAEHGVGCYRSAANRPAERFRRSARKLARTARPGRISLVEPTVDEYGLVDVPPSLFLFEFEGAVRTAVEAIGADPVVRQARRGIDRASREDGIFHVWLHPNNLLAARDARRVRAVVGYAAAVREETDLRIETMAEVAARTR